MMMGASPPSLMRLVPIVFLLACSSAQWTDTFKGTDTRTLGDAEGLSPDDDVTAPDDGGAVSQCQGLANYAKPVSIIVTFPNHGGANETIHIVVSSQHCDIPVDTDMDGVVFASDTSACAPLIAVGTPSSGTATATGPSDLLFQWTYGVECTINDDYQLDKQ